MKKFTAQLEQTLSLRNGETLAAGILLLIEDVVEGNYVFRQNGKLIWANAHNFQVIEQAA